MLIPVTPLIKAEITEILAMVLNCNSLVNLAKCTTHKELIGNIKNMVLTNGVSCGVLKKRAMKGALPNSKAYKEIPISKLMKNTVE